ncbi:MAG: alpha-amylase [Bdellovibrio sp.]
MLSNIWVRILSYIFFIFISIEAHAAPRTVFVQLFEWSWKDIAKECEIYLGPAGFAAVQVSPPHEHIVWNNSPWWERYQVASYNLNSRSGNEDEFADMVRRCKNVGVDIYADAVINHTAGVANGTGFGGSTFSHYNYPGIYSYNDFHHCGRNGNDNIVNYGDRYEVQFCELVDLADLATESEYVRSKIAQYMNHLLDLGVAGFRIDGAKHIPAQDLAAIYSKLKRSAYIFHELIYDPNGPVQYNEYTPYGDVLVYSYPFAVGYAFKGKNTSVLQNLGNGLPASESAIVSLTNHDLERTNSSEILSFNHSDRQLYRLAQVFMLAWPYGYPQLYSGFKFDNFNDGPPLTWDKKSAPTMDDKLRCIAPWTCEHRLPEVAAMVQFRNQTDKAFYYTNWWSNGYDQVAFGRGNLGYVAINFSDYNLQRDFSTGLPAGQYCNILSSSYNIYEKTCSDPITVNDNGSFKVNLPPMSALALLRTSPFRLRLK